MKTRRTQAHLLATATLIALTIASLSQLNQSAWAKGPRPDVAQKAPQLALWSPGELVFQVGERHTFNAKGIDRLSIESAEMIGVKSKGDELWLVGLTPGLTTLHLTRGDEELLRYARVAYATPAEVIQKATATGEIKLPSACLKGKSLGERQFRLVLNPKGRVLQAQLDHSEGLDAGRTSCLLDAAKRWSFDTTGTLERYTVALISLEL